MKQQSGSAWEQPTGVAVVLEFLEQKGMWASALVVREEWAGGIEGLEGTVLEGVLREQQYREDLSIRERLKEIENKHREGDTRVGYEEFALKLRNEYESSMKQRVKDEVQRIRELEINNVRIEEARKQWEALVRTRKDIEEQWKDILNSEKEKSRQVVQEITQELEETRKNNKCQENKLLVEIENLKKCLNEAKDTLNLETKRNQIHRRELETERKLLEKEMLKLEVFKTKHKRKLHEEFLSHKRELESGLAEEKKTLCLQRNEIEMLTKQAEIKFSAAKDTIEKADDLEISMKDLSNRLENSEKDQEKYKHLYETLLTELNQLQELHQQENALLIEKSTELTNVRIEYRTLKDSQSIHKLTTFPSNLPAKAFRESINSKFIAGRSVLWEEIEQEEERIRKGIMELAQPPLSKSMDVHYCTS